MRTFLLRKPMRGKDDRSEILFSYIRLDERIPADHPLRVIRQLVDAALAELSRAFAKLYARDGRPGRNLQGGSQFGNSMVPKLERDRQHGTKTERRECFAIGRALGLDLGSD
jgi:hypothetical protein